MADGPKTTPRVVNKYHGGQHALTGGVYIGRPSRWGNPFQIGRDGSRAQVVAKYRDMVCADPALQDAARRELRGRDLICFCAPAACHGDVLLEYANAK